MTIEVDHYEFTEEALRVNTKAEISAAVWNYKALTVGAGLLLKVLAANVGLLYNSQIGNWEIKDNQMIVYDTNNDVMLIYSLFDSAGNPSMTEVFKRELT